MTKLFGHSVRSELLALYLAETIVCFATIYLLLVHGAAVALPIDHTAAVACAAVLALSSGLVSSASGLYQPAIWRRFGRFLLGTLFAALLLLLVAHLVLLVLAPDQTGAARWTALGEVLVALVAATMATHLAFALARRGGLLTRRLAVLHGPDSTLSFQREPAAADLRQDPVEVAITGTAAALEDGRFSPAMLRAQRVWAVVAADPAIVPGHIRASWRREGVRLLSEAEFQEQRLNRVDLARLPEGWLATAASQQEGQLEATLRRGFDILGSLALLLIALPVVLVAAILIKLESRGPVFYRQERVGLHGRIFTVFKLRSMVVDAEAAGRPVWAKADDPRVTRVGHYLRKLRIDEVPQLWNVLRGEMALVGPRPERPAFVEQLGRQIPRYDDRASVKPGITGWAQVNYSYGASVDDARMKLAYDLYYVKHRSLFLDLLILVATVRVVLFQEGSR